MDFDELLKLHTGERSLALRVGTVPLPIARALGAVTRDVLLSRETIEKQLMRHRDLPISYYRCLGRCLKLGDYRRTSPRTAIVLLSEAELYRTNFRAYIKATAAGDEIYLASFLAMRDRDYRRELRKPYPRIEIEPLE